MNQSQRPGCREWGSPLWVEQSSGEFANITDTVKLTTGECNILQMSKLGILWIIKAVPPTESHKVIVLLCYISMIWMNECVGAWLPGSRSSKSDKRARWHLLEFNVGDSFLFRIVMWPRLVAVTGLRWTYHQWRVERGHGPHHSFRSNFKRKL